ncbi:MAG: hypothetical protein VB081_12375 [Christensenella sp.]|uniref:hypothetical protein n=1 Tax=Christensenella sp. TaxID=1935934 RepID=UPI002B1F449D|nr:hypothetical protein [Christensenella sp.]MEA5004277.1 hypothetical protein [Christensenella sp.]
MTDDKHRKILEARMNAAYNDMEKKRTKLSRCLMIATVSLAASAPYEVWKLSEYDLIFKNEDTGEVYELKLV